MSLPNLLSPTSITPSSILYGTGTLTIDNGSYLLFTAPANSMVAIRGFSAYYGGVYQTFINLSFASGNNSIYRSNVGAGNFLNYANPYASTSYTQPNLGIYILENQSLWVGFNTANPGSNTGSTSNIFYMSIDIYK